MASKPRKNKGVLSHIMALILTFLGTLFLFLVLLLNVPLPSDPAPLATDIRHRFWMVQITDTTGHWETVKQPRIPKIVARRHLLTGRTMSTITAAIPPSTESTLAIKTVDRLMVREVEGPTARIPIPITTQSTASPPRKTSSSDDVDDDDDDDDDNGKNGDKKDDEQILWPQGDTTRPRGEKGDLVFGFGVYGWCEWLQGDDWGYSYCRTKAFWQLPRDAFEGDTVLEKVLPSSLTASLSIACFFIIFAIIQGIYSLSALIYSLIVLIRSNWSSTPVEERPKGVWLQYSSQHLIQDIIAICLYLAFCLPALIISGIAIGRINETRGNMVADHGMGVGFLAAGMSLLISSRFLQMLTGSRVVKWKA